MTEFKETEAAICLHGLGFIQVKLGGDQRLHVWHPDLPRRTCAVYSNIHNHRFGFASTVLRGMQINTNYGVFDADGLGGCRAGECDGGVVPTHIAYLHDGERLPTGNRPWLPRGRMWVGQVSEERVEAGQTYHMLPKVFHSTTPGGDGRVATIMTKTFVGEVAATSLCEVGVTPDVDFDRNQWAASLLWEVVREVLEG